MKKSLLVALVAVSTFVGSALIANDATTEAAPAVETTQKVAKHKNKKHAKKHAKKAKKAAKAKDTAPAAANEAAPDLNAAPTENPADEAGM